MLRKFTLAGAILALFTGVASAQMPMPGVHLNDEPKQLTPQEREKQKALDDAYKAATKKIPEKKASNDPWGSVRPNPSNPPAKQ
jgi:hypothetical protein